MTHLTYREVIALAVSTGHTRWKARGLVEAKVIQPDPLMANLRTAQGMSVRRKYRQADVLEVLGVESLVCGPCLDSPRRRV